MGTPCHSSKLHLDTCSSVGVQRVTDTLTDGREQCTFRLAVPNAKCNQWRCPLPRNFLAMFLKSSVTLVVALSPDSDGVNLAGFLGGGQRMDPEGLFGAVQSGVWEVGTPLHRGRCVPSPEKRFCLKWRVLGEF